MQEKTRDQLLEELDALKQRVADLESTNQRTQSALQKMEDRHNDLFENAGDSIFIVDAYSFKILDANVHAGRRLGYERDELLALTLNDIEILSDEAVTEEKTSWESSFSQTRFYECRHRRKNGSILPVEVSSRLVTYDGAIVFQNFVRDISRRKELEDARTRAEAEALRLATVIKQASETILITDLNGDILYANPHFAITTGYEVDEALGHNPRVLKSGLQEASFYETLWHTISAGDNWHGTFTNRRKDGTLYYEDATIFPIKDATQHIIQYAAVKRDITERVIAENEREELISELNAFAHTVAHDLKAPLALLRGYSNMLLEAYGELSESEIRDMLTAIDDGGAKMGRIIDELLVLASTRQSGEVARTPLDMVAIAHEAIARFQVLVQEHHPYIVFIDPEKWPVAIGYAAWIEEVWANYVSNAIKYGGEAPHIEIGADRQGDDLVRFWVKDHGAGLSAEQQTHLFKPFTRLGDIRIQGNGLGLSIVQRIVNRLGGQVAVESAVGQGSTFSFTLPTQPIEG